MTDFSLTDAITGIRGLSANSRSLESFQTQNGVAMRIRALTRVNPYMGQRPDVLMSMAQSPLSTADLVDHGAAMFGMQASDSIKTLMEGMSPASQRATWASLTPGQQQSLKQQGFSPTERDEGSILGTVMQPIGFVGNKVINAVQEVGSVLHVGDALDAMMWLTDQPAHLYRAIRTMDDSSQWAALAGAALAVGAVATGGFGLLAAGALIGEGTLATVGALGAGAAIGGTAAAAATAPTDWYHAWMDSRQGERTFDRASQEHAKSILGDPRLVNLSHDLAYLLPQDYSLTDLAKEMAGTADPTIETQTSILADVAAKFAARGTNEFQKVMGGMVQLIQDPSFQRAVRTLQNGKISIGRDTADVMGFAPGTRWHTLVSGSIDGMMQFALDPMLIAGRVGEAVAFARRGIPVSMGEQAVDRFYQIFQNNRGVQKMHEAIAAAVESGDYAKMRTLAPTMKERWTELLSYRDELVRTGKLKDRAFEVKDFHDWMVGQMHLEPLMQGFGTVRGMNNGVMLAQLGRQNEAWRAVAGRVRAFTDGLTDIKMENNLLEQLAAGGNSALKAMLPETVFYDVAKAATAGELNDIRKVLADNVEAFARLNGKQLETYGTLANDLGTNTSVMEAFRPGHEAMLARYNQLTNNAGLEKALTISDVTPELLQEFALRNEQYGFTRLVGRTVGSVVPGAASVGELLTKMTTMVPAGKAIHLVGFNAAEDIHAMTELAGLTGMPQWLRKEWADMLLYQPTVGLRMTSMQAFVDSMLTTAGIRSMPEGEELANKYLNRIFQSYAAGGLDTLEIGGRITKQGIYLDEMADAIPMPNLLELRKAVQGGIVAKAIGLADLPVLEQFQTRVWKPSVLLRLGFIPRAAGEEFLNYMLRGGFGPLGQELAGRSIARLERYNDLVAMEKNLDIVHTAASDLKLLSEGPMPAGTRWVSQILGRHKWADPVTNLMERYSVFYRNLLEEGMGQGERVGNILTGLAGTEFPLYNLADNVQDLNKAREALGQQGRLRLSLAMTANNIALGNPLSWRRMAVGGVNDDVVEAMYAFFGANGTSVMRAVGATNAGPFDPGSSRQDHIRIRIEDDMNGAPQYADYIVLKGQRTMRMNGDPYFANAMHHQAARPMQDELQRTVVGKHVARLRPETVQIGILPDLLDAYHGAQTNLGKEIINEFLLEPSWTRWQAVLDRMHRIEPDLANHLSRTITRSNLSLERVTQAVTDLASKNKLMHIGYEMLSKDLQQWGTARSAMNSLERADHDWVASFIAHSERGTAEGIRDVVLHPNTEIPRPSRVLYRGVSSPAQYELVHTPDGLVLRLHGQYQDWFGGKSLSTTQNYYEALEYGTFGHDGVLHGTRTEYNQVLHLDQDRVEQLFGPVQDLHPDYVSYNDLPNAKGRYADQGAYRIGPDGQVNINLGKTSKTETFVDLADNQELTTFADNLQRTLEIYTSRQVAENLTNEIRNLVDLPGAARNDALDALAFAQNNEVRGIIIDHLSNVQESRVEQDFIDFLPGQWRIESAHSMNRDAVERQLNDAYDRWQSLHDAIQSGQMQGHVNGEAYWASELKRHEQQVADLEAKLKAPSEGVPLLGANELSPQAQFFDEIRGGLQGLSEDELLNLLLGGEVKTTNSALAQTYNKPMSMTARAQPDSDGVYTISDAAPLRIGVEADPNDFQGISYEFQQAHNVSGTRTVDGPGHFAWDANGVIVHELAQRWGVDIETAVERLVDTNINRLRQMSDAEVDNLFHENWYAQYEHRRRPEFSAPQPAPEYDVSEMRTALESWIRNKTRERAIVPSLGIQFRGTEADLEKMRAPWDAIAVLKENALKGGMWGTMPRPTPFYSSWDEMSQMAVRDLTNAMHDPHYASRLGHMQGINYDALPDGRSQAEFAQVLSQHDNMVTVWKPGVPTAVRAAGPMEMDDLLRHATNRQLLLQHQSEVEAFIAGHNADGVVPVVANRALADEIGRAAQQFGYKDLGLELDAETVVPTLAVDVPRSVIASSSGAAGYHPVAGTEEHPLVWNVNADAWHSRAAGAVRHPDAQLDQSVEQLAERMMARNRQIWTRGNKEVLVPKTRVLDDGTVQTVVQSEGVRGLEHLTPGEKITAREQFYDHNGNAIDFGDERYFDRVAENGDGEVLWPLVAPILMDGRDEVVGRSLFHTKSVLPAIGEELPAQKELVRAYRSQVEHVNDVGKDLPNMVDSEVLATYKRSRWDEFVRKGFDNVIGPSIDALARRPMAAHFYAHRFIQNKALRNWLRDPVLVDRVNQIASNLISRGAADVKDVEQVAEYSRVLARYTEGANTTKWTDAHSLGWLRGHSEAELPQMIADAQYRLAMDIRQGLIEGTDAKLTEHALNKMARRDVAEMRSILPNDVPHDDFLAYIRANVMKDSLAAPDFYKLNARVIEEHPILSQLSGDEWVTIQRAEKNYQHILREAGDHAAVAAINDMVPFIDSHEFKTQFAEYGRNFLPFWYAEENFMKRWARTLILEGPAVIQKAQLTYMGLKTAGVVRTDPTGRDWFVYPGSNLLQEAVNQIPGLPDLPVGVMFQSPTDMMLPGINSRFGSPQFGPLVSVPMDLFTVPFPELKNTERQILGDLAASKSALDQLVPAVLANTFNAITADDGDQRYASAQLAAIAQLQAEGKGLPDNATPGQVDEFLRTVRNHARVIVFSQALGGWFAPGPVSQIVTGDSAPTLGGLDALLGNGQIDDPSQVLSSMYTELVRNLGIEEGTIEYLKLAPLTDVGEIVAGGNALAFTTSKNASISGAPLPATEQALTFFDQNANYMDEFPNAGPWLLPIDPNATTAHSQYAYDQQTISGLRRRRTPEEFLTQIKFKEGSTRYFQMRSEYLTMVERARTDKDQARVSQLNNAWNSWATTYKAAHPVFAEQLEGSGARERRKKVIAEMRVIARDPNAPTPPHFDVLRQIITDFDQYLTMKQEFSLDPSAKGRLAVERLKGQWEDYMNQIVLTNPAVQSFWTGVLRPESELE